MFAATRVLGVFAVPRASRSLLGHGLEQSPQRLVHGLAAVEHFGYVGLEDDRSAALRCLGKTVGLGLAVIEAVLGFHVVFKLSF